MRWTQFVPPKFKNDHQTHKKFNNPHLSSQPFPPPDPIPITSSTTSPNPSQPWLAYYNNPIHPLQYSIRNKSRITSPPTQINLTTTIRPFPNINQHSYHSQLAQGGSIFNQRLIPKPDNSQSSFCWIAYTTTSSQSPSPRGLSTTTNRNNTYQGININQQCHPNRKGQKHKRTTCRSTPLRWRHHFLHSVGHRDQHRQIRQWNAM